ncbi:glycosyltransferase family 4 protein [Gottschalkiaceae bacterium SANA]|nr:glycosyltransferase family 4 protein [Gottschalkiaceae bacterium SANA]
MKVAILLTSVRVGGAEMQVYRILSMLNREKIEVIVISMRPFDEVGALIESLGIQVYYLNMTKGISYFRGTYRLYRILCEFQPDLLSTFLYHANILGRFVGHMAGVPRIISSIRNIHFGGKRREWLVKTTDGLVDLSIMNSRISAERMVKDKLLKPQKAGVIVNGIDPTGFYKRSGESRQVLREKLGLSIDNFVWISIGRFDPQKNFMGLLENFRLVVENQPRARLLLAGDGPLRQLCESYVLEHGLSKYVEFLGIRKDIADLLSLVDGYVLSSLWEGLPNVLMEAACAELPVVAMDVGGVAELIKEEEYGFLVSNSKQLSASMIRMMAVPLELREEMGRKSRQHVVGNYSLSAIVNQWESLYLEE